MKFCDPKIKILLKEVKKPVFGEDEIIKVNLKFASNTIQSNLIPMRIYKTNEEKRAAVTKQIERERQFVVQAHIVKIMKAQKTYPYQ